MSFSFDNIRSTNENTNAIGYFALKNDGDQALVRFMHDTIESFDVVDMHEVEAGGKRRRVCCTRTINDPVEKCPFCAAGVSFKQRMYVHLLEYTSDASGNITVTPKVWDRPAKYAYKLRDFINNYGPLSDMLFIIKRNGAAGDTNTTYSEMPAMPNKFPPEAYPKTDAFANYTARGNIVMERSASDMQAYLNTGNFPAPSRSNQQPAAQSVPTPAIPQRQAPMNFNTPAMQPSTITASDPTGSGVAVNPNPVPTARPWDNGQTPTPAAQRPVRFF